MPEAASPYQGTIYEPFDLFTDDSHVVVVHVDPGDDSRSPALRGRHISSEEMKSLACRAEAIFCESFKALAKLHRLDVGGFLVFALGFNLCEDDITQYGNFQTELKERLKSAIERIKVELELVANLSLSSIHPNTQNVYDAYHEAFSIALHFLFLENEWHIISADELQTGLSPASAAVKAKLEKRWYACTEAGDFEDSEKLLLQIIELRMSSPQTAMTMKQELINRLNYIVYLLCDSKGLCQTAQECLLRRVDLIRGVKNMQELKNHIKLFYVSMAEAAGKGSNKSESDWARQISSYVKNNYSNPTLSVNTISSRFKMNPAYVSHLFYKGTGIKLLDFIHGTRVEQVKRLLLNTNMGLPDIAQRTGYYDRYAMSRVFSRYVGIPPSNYRRK